MRAATDAIEGAISWIQSKSGDIERALASLVEINSYTSNVSVGTRVGTARRSLFEKRPLR